jgi:hypothetical protein
MSRGFARIAVAFATLVLPCFAVAAPFRAYLSSSGSDSNPCTVTQPCRLLPAALAAVADGGEIWILDSANFNAGTVDIAKSVSILAVPGQVGSIVAAAGAPAITITTPNVVVSMRNLAFSRNASNPGTYGIEMTNGSSLTVEDSVFAGFDRYAVYPHDFEGAVSIKHTTFRNLADYAMFVQNGPTVAVLASQFTNTKGAADVSGDYVPTRFAMSDSSIANCNIGVHMDSEVPSADLRVMLTHARIESCTTGLHAVNGLGNPFVTVWLGDSFFANNQTGVNQLGGAVYTAGNNQFSGNTTDVQGTLTAAPLR